MPGSQLSRGVGRFLLPGAILALALAGSSAEKQTPKRVARPAFAGAQGFGAMSAGGRGGRVIAVTTLADAGRGSLRSCIDQAGPRICVFRVSGVIRFTQRPPVISKAFITIAGQTAPGGGITLAHRGGPLGYTPLLIKGTHDVIVRDIRVRPDLRGDDRGANDAITIEDSRNVILDHVSGSWGLDEIVNGQGDNENVTISWSIFAEGLPRHDKCALLGSDPKGPQRMSFINNICAHNGDRNPDLNFTPGSCVEVINNLFYNAQSQFAEVWESYGGTPVSIVGNVFRAGPNTGLATVGIDRQRIGSRGAARVYISDNIFDGAFTNTAPGIAEIKATRPSCPLSIRPQPAAAAYRAVLATAGAWPRDKIDQRIVAEVRSRTGHIRKAAGTIPAVTSPPAPADTDNDGMPDGWERSHGSNAAVADAWQDANRDGVPNFDEYLDDAHRAALAR